MIFQAYITFTEFNKTGLAGLLTYPAHVWAGFTPLLLFALFSIVLMSTFFSQKRLSGRGDFFSSFAAAGYFTAIIAFVMTLVEGMINITTLVTCVSVALVGTILLLTSKNR